MKRFSRSLLMSGLVATGLLAVVACGDDATNTDGAGGDSSAADFSSIEKQIADLEKQIADLEKQLETASGAAADALKDQISDLQDQLDDLNAPTCGNGGTCTGLSSSIDGFAPIIDAMCSQMFNCCTTSQEMAALGPAIDTAEKCSEVMSARLERGENPNNFAYGYSFKYGMEWPDIGDLAASLEAGTVVIDEDAVAACAAMIDAVDCDSAYGSYGPPSCGNPVEASCAWEDFIIGQAELGGTCRGYADFDECVEGTHCDADEETGSCVSDGAPGEYCFTMYDCGDDLYCDLATSKCTEPGEVGDSCAFNSSQPYYQENLTKPCADGLECNVSTLKCQAECALDAYCSADYECGEGRVCEYVPNQEGGAYGHCIVDPRKEVGGSCSVDNDCRSGACNDVGATTICVDMCYNDDMCESGEICQEGGCIPLVATGGVCDDDEDCKTATDRCLYNGTDNVCTALAAPGGACPGDMNDPEDASEVCPTGQHCEGTTCTNNLALNADCDESLECGPAAYCNTDTDPGKCLASAGRNQDCEDTPCAGGLSCASYYDGTETQYRCLPDEGLRKEGEFCGNFPTRKFASRCEDSRCRWADGGTSYATCQKGKVLGAACDATEAFNAGAPSSPNLDECAAGSYCKVTNLDVDLTGKCVARLAPGQLCDTAYPESFSQCADDTVCDNGSPEGYRCQAQATQEEVNMCLIAGPYSVPGRGN